MKMLYTNTIYSFVYVEKTVHISLAYINIDISYQRELEHFYIEKIVSILV